MFMILLALFIIVPLLELWVIFELGSNFGYATTLLVLLLISIAGAALAKNQGYAVVARIRNEINLGKMPGDSLIDGALILSGALMLLFPGFITDTVGLLLLLPPVRRPVRRYIKRRLGRAIERRTLRIITPEDPFGRPGGSQAGPHGPGPGRSPGEPEQRRKELEK